MDKKRVLKALEITSLVIGMLINGIKLSDKISADSNTPKQIEKKGE